MLDQLQDLIRSLDAESYGKPLEILNGATLGEHIRHSVEFFQAYLQGSRTGRVCYDRRQRDPRIQNDPAFALETVEQIRAELRALDEQRAEEPLELDVEWLERSEGSGGSDGIPSNFCRELHYVQDHLLHHSALVKVGLFHGLDNPTAHQIRDMERFGVAPSTLAYQASLNQ